MAEPAAAPLADSGGNQATGDQSVGDLVSLAISDLTRLVRCEVELARTELRSDMRRVGTSALLLVMAGTAGSLVLVLLSFAYAYGLHAAGIWDWAAFLIAAGTCAAFAILAMLIVRAKMRRMSGLRRTRTSVQDDLALLRRDEEAAVQAGSGAG